MELICKLIEKTFTDKDGVVHPYQVLSFELYDGSRLDIPIKGDKAKLLKLSNSLDNK